VGPDEQGTRHLERRTDSQRRHSGSFSRTADDASLAVHRFNVEQGNGFTRNDHHIDALIRRYRERDRCRCPRVHGKGDALELLPLATKFQAVHTHGLVEAGPATDRPRALAFSTASSQGSRNDESTVPRYELSTNGHEALSLDHVRRDVNARRVGRAQKDRGMNVSPLVNRQGGALFGINRNVHVVDRRRSTRVSKDALLERHVDEPARPSVLDGLRPSDECGRPRANPTGPHGELR
jgi:hypothetical protein